MYNKENLLFSYYMKSFSMKSTKVWRRIFSFAFYHCVVDVVNVINLGSKNVTQKKYEKRENAEKWDPE